MSRFVLPFLAALMLLAQGAAAQTFPKRELVIGSSGGPRHFVVEVATTDEQRQRGLMFRQDLASEAGMLFLYPSDREITMWMENTILPLDMIFFGSDGRIIRIAERAVPFSTEVIASEGPARGVVEVNGGTAARLGIRVGDKVEY
jgi:uncharacterized membrane protein (UPF0127 family)